VIDFARGLSGRCLLVARGGPAAVRLTLPQLSRQRPDHVEELSRIVSTICRGDGIGGCEMATQYVAASVLILLIVWGVTGILTQDKFRL
jgi:hypothetical protein